MGEQLTLPVVALIVECVDKPGCILMQRRTKAEHPGLGDLVELPQGRVRAGESFMECAARELEEETGLRGFRLRTPPQRMSLRSERLECLSDAIVVSEVGSHSYFAVCVVGRASGSPRSSDESSDPRWVARAEVIEMIHRNSVYPLNVPMLLEYYRQLGE